VDAERSVRHTPAGKHECLDHAGDAADLTLQARADEIHLDSLVDQSLHLVQGRRSDSRLAERVREAVEDAHG
jgi:hypothetical protein